jgi:hypothetical protein
MRTTGPRIRPTCPCMRNTGSHVRTVGPRMRPICLKSVLLVVT